jgi:glycosyltransferase involved in cell wall biosynthesis
MDIKENSPLISIAMATYNGEKYLEEQLDSIYAQTYKNIEVIVTDDCSTDGTIEILEQYAQDQGLKYYINTENLGFVKNFEKAISFCSGEYIALSDQDDIWEREKLETLLGLIGDKLLIHSDATIIDENGECLQEFWKKEHGYNIGFENFFFNNVVTGCTVLMHRALLDMVLPIPSKIVYHDWWFGVCAASQQSILYTKKKLVKYRRHTDQDTGVKLKQSLLKKIIETNIKRFFDDETDRVSGSKKHLQQLKVLKYNKRCSVQQEKIVDDAIMYLSNYLKSCIHFRTFILGLKYHKYIYPQRNYFYIKNILFDIVG